MLLLLTLGMTTQHGSKGEVQLASQPVSKPHDPSQEAGSPYCSDPNCVYCKELRQAQETLRHKSANQPPRFASDAQ